MKQISTLLQKYNLADVKATDKNGDTILHLAIKKKRHTPKNIIKQKSLQFLLDNGFNVNTKNKNQETVLHLAIKYRVKDVIEVLLTYNHNFEPTTTREDPVVTCLLETECFKISELEKQFQMFESEKDERKSTEFVEWILSKGFQINNLTVCIAIYHNTYHIVPALLKYMPVINNRRVIQNVLYQLIRSLKSLKKFRHSVYVTRNIAKVVKALVDKRLFPDDCDAEEQILVLQAINSEGHIRIIEVLIEHLKNVDFINDQGVTLFQIVFHEWLDSKELNIQFYKKILRALIDKGANINQPNVHVYIKIPLFNAIQKRNLRAIEFLHYHGADFTVTSADYDTLLHILLYSANIGLDEKMDIKLIDLFVENGCQVNARNKTGQWPLGIAIEKGYMAITRKLIELGADVNCKINQGITPLHYACKYVQPDLAELLLESGANVNAIDDEGNTALNYAIINTMIKHHNGLHKILLEYGVKLNEDFSFIPERHRVPEVVDMNSGFRYERSIIMYGKFEDLTQHWIKLLAANFKPPANSEYKNLARKMVNHQFYQKCIDEIEILKYTFVDKSNRVSFYTFLHMDPNRRRSYINSKNFKSLINKQKRLEQKFPNYAVLIMAFYRETVTRKGLLKSAKQVWLELTGISLPDICLEYIFSFMSNSDLFLIIEKD